METASSFFSNYSSIEAHYYLTDFDESTLSISIEPLSPLVSPVPGQIISSGFCSFYITSPSSASYISGDVSTLSSYSTFVTTFPLSLPKLSYKVIDSTVPLGSILVNLSLPLFHKPGYLGWSLIKDNTLILAGNDLFSNSTISFYSSSNWTPGNYRLALGLYEPSTKGLYSVADKEWFIEQPVPLFKFGFEDDSSNSIKL